MNQSYFRILVSQGDIKLFRTSRITTGEAMILLLGRVRAGFPTSEGFDVQVLGVACDPDTGVRSGAIVSAGELTQMSQVLTEAQLAAQQASGNAFTDEEPATKLVGDNNPGLTD